MVYNLLRCLPTSTLIYVLFPQRSSTRSISRTCHGVSTIEYVLVVIHQQLSIHDKTKLTVLFLHFNSVNVFVVPMICLFVNFSQIDFFADLRLAVTAVTLPFIIVILILLLLDLDMNTSHRTLFSCMIPFLYSLFLNVPLIAHTHLQFCSYTLFHYSLVRILSERLHSRWRKDLFYPRDLFVLYFSCYQGSF